VFVVKSCFVLGGVFVCELWLCWVVGLFCWCVFFFFLSFREWFDWF
jgi:hypothetical protein